VAASTRTGFPLPEMSHRIFQPLKHYSRSRPFGREFRRFERAISSLHSDSLRSYRKHSLSLIARSGTDSALQNLENKIRKQQIQICAK
jgi:hypothetical protein